MRLCNFNDISKQLYISFSDFYFPVSYILQGLDSTELTLLINSPIIKDTQPPYYFN